MSHAAVSQVSVAHAHGAVSVCALLRLSASAPPVTFVDGCSEAFFSSQFYRDALGDAFV